MADYANETSGLTTSRPKQTSRKWLYIGIPVAVVVVLAAVLGGVLGSRAARNDDDDSASAASPTGDAAASQAVSIKEEVGVFPTGTDSQYLLPIYPSTTNSAAFTSPTFVPSNNDAFAWPEDPFQPSNPSPTEVRTDRPRLIAPAYKWEALPKLIPNDPYLQFWNDSIFGNATEYFDLDPVEYHLDGGSGILDNAREIKMRVKAFAYVYRMTNDSRWLDRTYAELQNAISDNFPPSGAEKWNPTHFLDTAELTAAFAIAYDWLYEAWTDDQKNEIRSAIITYGLEPGQKEFTTGSGWWANDVKGNWNCVCNSGLTMGALAILGDDQSGIAEDIIGRTVPNAVTNCVHAVSSDGTWAETANYWYFGITGAVEMTASLMTATGSDHGLLTDNADLFKTGLYHMYVSGPGSLFAYGDHGPNKFSTTANAMLFYGDHFQHPEFVLFQRDQHDAPEPNSMFWYNPTVSGAFWDGLPLDHFFDNDTDQWGSMRSSWTDGDALYVAIKAGTLQGHQTHNDLDLGDFVLDAMGTRWAGELGSGDYLSPEYFNSDAQDATRWLYYRKRTEGQNTILVNKANQLVGATPSIKFDSSNTQQDGATTVYTPPDDSTAYFVADLSSGYNNVNSFKRGIRMINGRKQVLLQDDIDASGDIMWRMHTNATVETSGTSATLRIGDKTMQMTILNPPDGVTLTTGPAQRFEDDPPLPEGASDQENPGVTVVMINLPAGSHSLQVLFNPQWDGMPSSDFKTPQAVAIDDWSLTSHP
ncbi:chondroitin AC/alginate lyase [Earliella scabrosa]|nr:chondroitin AC/alginate lyase [Earliella scabrosa]